MTQENDAPEENVQALRAIVKSTMAPPAAEEDIVYVDCQHDPATDKEVVLWDDVMLAFNDALHVRHKARILPFLKGPDFRVLEPRRIAAVPDTVLDVIIECKEQDANKQQQQLQHQREILQEDTTSSETTTSTITRHGGGGGPQIGVSQEVTITKLTITESPAVISTASTTSRAPQTIPEDNGDNDTIYKNSTDQPDNNDTHRGPQLYVENLNQTHTNADLGDVAAQVKLGDMYLEGKVAPQNYQLAMKWYLKAAEQGDADAQCKVGNIHCKGLGVQQDQAKGMEWYLKAAKQGNAPAQCNIAIFYSTGEGVTRDSNQAAKWYRKSAEQGYAPAQRSLGNLYRNGAGGMSLDYTKAMQWYLEASGQGNVQAQADIGTLYYSGLGIGEGIPKDYSKAYQWYCKSAEQGDGSASNNVGLLYHKGLGVVKDFKRAMDWYKQAVEQGNLAARTNIEAALKDLRKLKK
ncbi:hypothetical protein BG015_007544 [Linnemannia schmuckeri]|uniref:HCP-like protein n=1 Tax=Linnemannia schmuckeri TaxID=64567 RepID=A0A9P5RYY4_9FUNG|nr:hypothetical protein BG015_007544 [Linnemannia schmuckeri]